MHLALVALGVGAALGATLLGAGALAVVGLALFGVGLILPRVPHRRPSAW